MYQELYQEFSPLYQFCDRCEEGDFTLSWYGALECSCEGGYRRPAYRRAVDPFDGFDHYSV